MSICSSLTCGRTEVRSNHNHTVIDVKIRDQIRMNRTQIALYFLGGLRGGVEQVKHKFSLLSVWMVAASARVGLVIILLLVVVVEAR